MEIKFNISFEKPCQPHLSAGQIVSFQNSNMEDIFHASFNYKSCLWVGHATNELNSEWRNFYHPELFSPFAKEIDRITVYCRFFCENDFYFIEQNGGFYQLVDFDFDFSSIKNITKNKRLRGKETNEFLHIEKIQIENKKYDYDINNIKYDIIVMLCEEEYVFEIMINNLLALDDDNICSIYIINDNKDSISIKSSDIIDKLKSKYNVILFESNLSDRGESFKANIHAILGMSNGHFILNLDQDTIIKTKSIIQQYINFMINHDVQICGHYLAPFMTNINRTCCFALPRIWPSFMLVAKKFLIDYISNRNDMVNFGDVSEALIGKNGMVYNIYGRHFTDLYRYCIEKNIKRLFMSSRNLDLQQEILIGETQIYRKYYSTIYDGFGEKRSIIHIGCSSGMNKSSIKYRIDKLSEDLKTS